MNPISVTMTRRSLLRAAGTCTLEAYLSRIAKADTQTESIFQPVDGPLPDLSAHFPKLPVAAPANASAVAFDNFGNWWALVDHRLNVLPAQHPERWIPDTLSSLPEAEWHALAADEFGFLWVAAPRHLMRLDPHTPQAAWTEFTGTLEIARACSRSQISALGLAPSGACLAAFANGALCEIDRDLSTTVKVSHGPPAINQVGTDADGNIWLRAAGRIYRSAAAPDAWQRTWQAAGRLPAGDHDLSGDLLPNGDFVMAGGQCAGFGYPAIHHTFRAVLDLDAATYRWRPIGHLKQARFYNATSVLDGNVWIMAGSRRDPPSLLNQIGEARALDRVEICDPATGMVTSGPTLPYAIEMPVALQIHDRIYVAGGIKRDHAPGSTPYASPIQGKLFSIGIDETEWRSEPAGPEGMSALAAAAHDGVLYLMLPGQGLFLYDTAARRWSQPAEPCPRLGGRKLVPRSPQMAFFRGELWVMGGRDVPNDGSFIFNPTDSRWRVGPKLPRELAWGAAGVVGGRLMIAGGAAGRGYSNRTFLLR